MAVSSGSGPHLAWVSINGQTFPVLDGAVTRNATRKSGEFVCSIPLWWPQNSPAVESAFSDLGDNTATISVQTRGQQATLMTGEIDLTDFDYIGGTLRIHGRDASAKLHAVKSAEKWINQYPQNIIQQLAGRVGLSTNIDPATSYAGRWVEIDWSKLTDGISYAAVIHKLAEFMGAHWYIDQSGTLNVKSTQNQAAPYTINWSRSQSGEIVSDALQLEVRRNVQAGKTLSVTINSWHERKKTSFSATSTVAGNGSTQNYVYHYPGLTQDQVKLHAQSKASDHSRHEIEVCADIVGDPTLTISQPLQLNGTAFSQTLTIDSIQDLFGMRGHITRIIAKSAAQGRTTTTSTASTEGGSDGN